VAYLVLINAQAAKLTIYYLPLTIVMRRESFLNLHLA